MSVDEIFSRRLVNLGLQDLPDVDWLKETSKIVDSSQSFQLLQAKIGRPETKEYFIVYLTDFFGKTEGIGLRMNAGLKCRDILVSKFSILLYDEYGADRYDRSRYVISTLCSELESSFGFPDRPVLMQRPDYTCYYGDERFEDAANYVYLFVDSTNSYFKIGTSDRPTRRLKEGRCWNLNLRISFAIPAPQSAETKLHRLFKKQCIDGEWYNLRREDLLVIRKFLLDYKANTVDTVVQTVLFSGKATRSSTLSVFNFSSSRKKVERLSPDSKST